MSLDEKIIALIDEAKIPVPMSGPGKYFDEQASRAVHIILHLINLSQLADNAAKVYIEGLENNNEFIDPSKNLWMKYVRDQSPVLIEMILCRMVDSFLTYFSEIIRLILLERPEILRTSESIKIDYVLRFSNYEELIRDLIDEKILKLSYMGFQDMNDWIGRRLGESVSNDPGKLQDIIEIIERRNAIVHNRGRIGQKYLRLVKNSPYNKDEILKTDFQYLFRVYGLLLLVVKEFDQKIAAKFSLTTS